MNKVVTIVEPVNEFVIDSQPTQSSAKNSVVEADQSENAIQSANQYNVMTDKNNILNSISVKLNMNIVESNFVSNEEVSHEVKTEVTSIESKF